MNNKMNFQYQYPPILLFGKIENVDYQIKMIFVHL